jgi:hypothetical protein
MLFNVICSTVMQHNFIFLLVYSFSLSLRQIDSSKLINLSESKKKTNYQFALERQRETNRKNKIMSHRKKKETSVST